MSIASAHPSHPVTFLPVNTTVSPSAQVLAGPGGSTRAGRCAILPSAKKPTVLDWIKNRRGYAAKSLKYKEQRIAVYRSLLLNGLETSHVASISRALQKLGKFAKGTNGPTVALFYGLPAQREQWQAQADEWKGIRLNIEGWLLGHHALRKSEVAGLQGLHQAVQDIEADIAGRIKKDEAAAGYGHACVGEITAPDVLPKFSPDGAEGSVLLTSRDTGAVLHVVKCSRDPSAANEATRLNRVMTEIDARATEPLPFGFPAQDTVKADDPRAEDVLSLLESAVESAPDDRKEHAQAALQNARNRHTVLLQQGLSGSKMSGMSDDDKLEALQDPDFLRRLGESILLGPLVGLGDHLSLAQCGYVNFSNLIYDKHRDPPLGVIDLGGSPNGLVVQGYKGLVDDLVELNAQLERDPGMSVSSFFSATSSLGPLMDSLFDSTFGDDGFMSKKLQAKLKQSGEWEAVKENAMRGIIAGLVDKGIPYFETNQGLFETVHGDQAIWAKNLDPEKRPMNPGVEVDRLKDVAEVLNTFEAGQRKSLLASLTTTEAR